MMIEELVRLLETYPPGLRVVVNGYEEGYDDLSPEQVCVVSIRLNAGVESWQGRHGDARDFPQRPPGRDGPVDALVLSRVSN